MGTRRVAIAVLTAGAAVFVFGRWVGVSPRLEVRHTLMSQLDRARVPDMIYGRAHRPFVLRTLIPSSVRVVRLALPDRWCHRAARSMVRTGHLGRTINGLRWERRLLVEYSLSLAITFGLLLGFGWALSRLWGDLRHDPTGTAGSAVAFVGFLGVDPFFQGRAHMLYDFGTLCLMTLALRELWRARWPRYYVVLALALLNKETAALLAVVFLALHWRRMPWRTLSLHLATHLALAALIRGVVLWVFRDNPGGVVEWHLRPNLHRMQLQPEHWFPLLLFVALFAIGLAHAEPLVRAASAMGFLMIPAYLIFGVWGEIRFFLEAYPVWVLALALVFHDGWVTAHAAPGERPAWWLAGPTRTQAARVPSSLAQEHLGACRS